MYCGSGVAQEVVALGGVAMETQCRDVEDGRQVGEVLHLFLALAELFLVEVRDVDGTLQSSNFLMAISYLCA